MGGRDGGTQMHCPECREIRVCTAIPTSQLGLAPGQRWERVGHEDIAWFRRGRECRSCANQWVTAEINEELLDELVTLRNTLADVKRNAEAYVRESEGAARALSGLTDSLQVLRGLNVYREEWWHDLPEF